MATISGIYCLSDGLWAPFVLMGTVLNNWQCHLDERCLTVRIRVDVLWVLMGQPFWRKISFLQNILWKYFFHLSSGTENSVWKDNSDITMNVFSKSNRAYYSGRVLSISEIWKISVFCILLFFKKKKDSVFFTLSPHNTPANTKQIHLPLYAKEYFPLNFYKIFFLGRYGLLLLKLAELIMSFTWCGLV